MSVKELYMIPKELYTSLLTKCSDTQRQRLSDVNIDQVNVNSCGGTLLTGVKKYNVSTMPPKKKVKVKKKSSRSAHLKGQRPRVNVKRLTESGKKTGKKTGEKAGSQNRTGVNSNTYDGTPAPRGMPGFPIPIDPTLVKNVKNKLSTPASASRPSATISRPNTTIKDTRYVPIKPTSGVSYESTPPQVAVTQTPVRFRSFLDDDDDDDNADPSFSPRGNEATAVISTPDRARAASAGPINMSPLAAESLVMQKVTNSSTPLRQVNLTSSSKRHQSAEANIYNRLFAAAPRGAVVGSAVKEYESKLTPQQKSPADPESPSPADPEGPNDTVVEGPPEAILQQHLTRAATKQTAKKERDQRRAAGENIETPEKLSDPNYAESRIRKSRTKTRTKRK